MGATLGCKRSSRESPGSAAAEEPPSKRQRGSVVVLNVGGARHSTSRDSLLKCEYFRILLGGDFADPPDEIFVDRDGELFRHLLKYMRTGRRLGEAVLRSHRRELLAEADFFGFDAFKRMLEGSTDPFQLLPHDRQGLADEEECARFFGSQSLSELELRDWERRLLVDVFSERSSFEARPAVELQVPLLRPHRGPDAAPVLQAADVEDFRGRLSDLIEPADGASASSESPADARSSRGRLLEELEAIGGLVIAGGSVLAALTGGEASDIDIFLVGGSAESAEARLREVLLAVKRNYRLRHPGDARVRAGFPSGRGWMKVARTMHAVTADRDKGSPPVQVMLTLYRCPLEVVLPFDIDVCAFLYDVSRKQVLCLPRARRALAHRANIANTSMRSPTYERRLEKYAKRGYAIGVPGLEEDALDVALLNGSYMYNREVDLLLQLGERTHETKEVCSQFTWSGTQLVSGQQQVASIVRGVRRLIVLDRLLKGLAHDAFASLQQEVEAASRGRSPRRGRHNKQAKPLLLSHGDVDHPASQLHLVSALEYKRFEPDGSLEEVSASDAQSAIACIRQLADLSKQLSPAGEAAWAQDLGNHAMMERAQERWSMGHQWEEWAQKRKAEGRPVTFVCGKTRWATDDLQDAEFAPVFDAGPSLEAQPEVPREISREMRFQRAEASTAAFFGRHGHAEYHKAHGDWFAGVYA